MQELITPAKYDCDYFIQKFEAIPEEKWAVCTYVNDEGQRCALGHCTETLISPWEGLNEEEWEEAKALRGILRNTPLINDGGDSRYPQPTPRARILAALRDAKAKEAK